MLATSQLYHSNIPLYLLPTCLQCHKLIKSSTFTRSAPRFNQRRTASATSKATSSKYQHVGDVAEKLGSRIDSRKKVNTRHDRRRVNIVSEELSKDVVSYLRSSLIRHQGCDLVDLNPGVGLFSRELHDLLRPRKHIMMDVDAAFYEPFTKDLTSQENVVVIPKSGAVWSDLREMMDEHLVHHRVPERGEIPQRNDKLLVVANVAAWPRSGFGSWENFGRLLSYQFISSIRNSALFQRYGLVRMLVWINEEDKRSLVPRSVAERRRMTLETELSCEWINEVVGLDKSASNRGQRDHWVDLESGIRTVARMRKHHIKPPPGRGTSMYSDLHDDRDMLRKSRLSVDNIPQLSRNWDDKIAKLEGQETKTDGEKKALKRLQASARADQTVLKHAQYLLQLQETIRKHETRKTSSVEKKRRELKEEWDKQMSLLSRNSRSAIDLLLDTQHHFRHTPISTFFWDRRHYEPLVTSATDFLPNAPLSLIDIQPKAPHPLLRERGPSSTRSGDMAELLLHSLWLTPTQPVIKSMGNVWPGFSEEYSKIQSLNDVTKGGFPYEDVMTVRRLTETQFIDILQHWTNWPFKPEYMDMFTRHLEYGSYEGEGMDIVEKEPTSEAETGDGEGDLSNARVADDEDEDDELDTLIR